MTYPQECLERFRALMVRCEVSSADLSVSQIEYYAEMGCELAKRLDKTIQMLKNVDEMG